MDIADRKPLFGMDVARLQNVASRAGMPRYAAGQIAAWLYKNHAQEIAQMSDLSLKKRELLAADHSVGVVEPAEAALARDGVKKYLFRPGGDCAVECVYIPDGERATLCVSSQAGCRMGCRFCATGAMGFRRDLSSGEILSQMASIPERDSLTNIVYMGMGEPLDNLEEVVCSLDVLTSPWGYGWSPSRVTLSTAGVLPALDTLLVRTRVNLAVSLHNPFPDQRARIMPIENAHPIEKVVAALRRHDFSHGRRLSFEYILMEGINDSPAHVRELARLLNGMPCRVNLIRFHKIPGSPYFSPPERKMKEFRDALSAKGFTTTIRASRGEDIDAACGLLSARDTGQTPDSREDAGLREIVPAPGP